MLLLNLIVPFVMVLVAKILEKHPVEDMGSHNGYNTPVSRRSQKHWDYAQKTAPDIFMSMGKSLFIIEIVLSLVMMFLGTKTNTGIIVGTGIGFGFIFLGFYTVDSQIEKAIEGK